MDKDNNKNNLTAQSTNNLSYKNHFAAAIVCLLFGTSTCLMMFKMSSIIPELIVLFDSDASNISFMMTIFTLISCFLAFPVAYFTRRMNILYLVIISSVITLAGVILGIFAINFGTLSIPVMFVSRAMEACSYIVSSISLPILLERTVNPKKKGVALSIFTTCIPIGCALGAFIAPSVFSLFGFEVLWIVSAFLIVFFCIVLCIYYKDMLVKGLSLNSIDHSESVEQSVSSKAGAERTSSIYSIATFLLSFTFFCIIEMAVYTFLPTHFRVNIGLDSSLAAIIGALPGLISIPFCLVCGKAADKLGSYKIPYVVGMTIYAIGMVMLYAFTGSLLVIGYAFVCIGFAAPAVSSLAIFELFGKRYASFGMALFICATCLGQTLGTTFIQILLGDDFSGTMPTAVFLLIFGVWLIISSMLSKPGDLAHKK